MGNWWGAGWVRRLRAPGRGDPCSKTKYGERTFLATALACLACAMPVDGQVARRPDTRLKLGISVLLDDQVSLVRNRRVILVTDVQARDERGRSVPDLFTSDRRATQARVSIAAVVRPEVVGGGPIAASLDSVAGHVNAIVVDLSDLGTRHGQAPRSLLDAMRNAAKRAVPIVLLDRPNPLTGEHAEGPAADSAAAASDGVYGLPARHGMTLGEIARWFNDVAAIGAELTVVPVRGWRRAEWPVARGIDPPALADDAITPEQLLLHSAFAPLAATNLRFGFGPGSRAVRIGAPWLDARRVAAMLNDRLIPGVEFSSGRDAFAEGNARGLAIPSVRISITDRERVSAGRILAALLAVIRDTHRDSTKVLRDRLALLTGSATFAAALVMGDDSDAIVDRDLQNVIAFRRRVRTFLLY